MASKHWGARRYERWDKKIVVDGPGVRLEVDYDDVDHRAVARGTKRMIDLLNAHWDADDVETERLRAWLRAIAECSPGDWTQVNEWAARALNGDPAP
jgi:hypothetical protein